MKSAFLVTIALSVLSFNSFSKDSAGVLLAGPVGKATLITIAGAPAKKIYSSLVMKGETNSVGTLKISPEIACLKVAAVNAYECKILVASNGDAKAMKNFNAVSVANKVGTIDAGGMSDYTNVFIGGEAAKLIIKSLTAAKTTSVQTGSLNTTVSVGGSISCTTSAAFAVSTNCKLSVTSNGNVEANFAR